MTTPFPLTPRIATRYISAPTMVRLVQTVGVAQSIRDIAQRVRADFCRWSDFDKTARVANHSDVGVIELMPIADTVRYSFKYVNTLTFRW